MDEGKSSGGVLELWVLVVEYGHEIRRKNVNGLEAWNKIKPLFEKVSVVGEWKEECCLKYYDEMKEILGVIEDEKGIDKLVWEKNHFYLQHGRIPYLNQSTPTLTRLMQIAFNDGQLYYEMITSNDPFYTKEWKDYYDTHNLGECKTYMSDGVLNTMKLTDEDYETIRGTIFDLLE